MSHTKTLQKPDLDDLTSSANAVLAGLAGVHPDKLLELSSDYLLTRICERHPEVFDVSGAGDTVISSFTLAIAAGADPIEAAILANHAAGIVVGKLGTATVSPRELLASF